jgi:hypothetical protein
MEKKQEKEKMIEENVEKLRLDLSLNIELGSLYLCVILYSLHCIGLL